MNSLIHLKQAETNIARLVYLLHTGLAALFFGIALFTLMRTVTQTALLPNVPLVVYVVIAFYAIPQFIIAYAFFRCQRWVISLITAHLVISVATFTIVMPVAGMHELIKTSVVSSVLYWALLFFVIATKKYTTGAYIHWFFIPAYTICIVLLIASRVYLY